MAHSKTKNWIHLIFSTKYRAPLITPKIEPLVFKEISDQLRALRCPLEAINGMPDHVHVLFLLHPQKALSEVVKQIKGSSSHAINRSELNTQKFTWGVGYAAFSVSESGVSAVRRYIQNQKAHHARRDSEQEFLRFIQLHGLTNEPEG
ncbi:MAG: IS200/IS605 family transposase [Saprospiraceae bacterium]|nr:IS200/IS605 family transposase [Saprospiraceae bacterium]